MSVFRRAIDTVLHATLGMQRVPKGVRVRTAAAAVLIGFSYGMLAVLLSPRLPSVLALAPFVIAGLGFVGVLLVRGVVRDVMRRNLDMEKDQGAAQQIQQGLHPDRLPQPEGYELAEHYRSVRHVGGDYYDAIADDDRRLLLAIADVSGKGMPAALITANLQAILKFVDLDAQPLERLVASINTHLCRHTEPGRFVTMILGVLELGSRRFTYVNAGHNPAMRLHDGKVCALESTAPPLGTIETLSFPSAEVTLAPGDVLVLYTDGLSERRNAAGAFFDERGVEEALATCDGRTAGEIVECLVAASEAFAKETPPVDDTAIVVVRVLPGPGAD